MGSLPMHLSREDDLYPTSGRRYIIPIYKTRKHAAIVQAPFSWPGKRLDPGRMPEAPGLDRVGDRDYSNRGVPPFWIALCIVLYER